MESWSAAIPELEEKLGRETLALALGVRPDELQLLAAGHDPGGDVLQRLRLLQELGDRVDLTDREALMQHLGSQAVLRLMPNAKLFLAAFLGADLLIAAGVVAFFVLR